MHSSGKTPLIRLAKRDGMAGAGQWGIRIAAILLALVVGGLVILLSGNNPIQGYAIIVEGALGKTSGIRQTVKNFIPLLGTALFLLLLLCQQYRDIVRQPLSPRFRRSNRASSKAAFCPAAVSVRSAPQAGHRSSTASLRQAGHSRASCSSRSSARWRAHQR